jgi:hypothetical protein
MPIKATEAAVEAELKTKGLNRPRLTPLSIDETIMSADFWRVPYTTVTVCALTLRNGYVVIGKSAADSPANFDEDMRIRSAHDDARNQIWALEGYLLRERLSAR